MPWTVVKFLSTNEVEAIPTSWVNKDLGKCLFPPKGNTSIIKKYIKNETDPDEDWQEFEINIMSHEEYATFKMASIKASRACIISDLDEHLYSPLPEKRQRRKKLFSESSCSSDSEKSLKGLPKFPTKGKVLFCLFFIVKILF